MFLFLFLGLVFWVKGISRRKRKREKEGGKGGGCYRYGFGLVWYGIWGILMVGKETVKEGFYYYYYYFIFISLLI